MNWKAKWFFHNLIRLPLVLIGSCILFLCMILQAFWITFTQYDGSSALTWPWQWVEFSEWKEKIK